MITLIIGPPESGKSHLAEQMLLDEPYMDRYYIATMKAVDEAGYERIRRHRAMRAGKGFTTLEIETDIVSAAKLMADPPNSAVLLECAANLTANMMYDPETYDICRSGEDGARDFARRAADKVAALADLVGSLIVVTGVYGPEEADDEETRLYKTLLDIVNIILRNMADKVIDTGVLQ